jgi:putative ABC transport system permease protein
MMFLRWPGLLAAVAAGTLLFTLAACASFLYVSAVAGEIVREQIAGPSVTRYGAGMSYRSTNVEFTKRAPGSDDLLFETRGDAFADRAGDSHLLGHTLMGMSGPVVSVSVSGDRSEVRPGRLFARTDALSNVTILAGSEGDGVWVADLIAGGLDLSVGDSITLHHEGRAAEVPVDGIYRGLYAEPRSSHAGYWLAWVDQIHKQDPTCDECPIPAPFVIADQEQAVAITKQLGEDSATFGWDAPAARRDLSMDDARDLASFVDEFGTVIQSPHSELGRLFDCCGRQFRGQSRFPESLTSFTSSIAEVVSQANDRIAIVESPVRLLLVTGLLVACGVLGAGGAFAMARRRAETIFMYVRGMSPIQVAGKAALESFLPCALGALAGLVLALWLVETFGPPGAVAESARRGAFVSAVVAVPVSVLLIGVVAALWFSRGRTHSPAHRARWRLPVELVLVVAAFFLLQQLQSEGAFVETEVGATARPTAGLLLFPVIFIAGLGTLGGRAVTGSLQLLRSRSARWPTWLYLALHRLASAPVLTILLVSTTTLCIGIFMNAQAVIQSLDDTVEAKAKLFVGSDVQANVNPEFSLPRSFPMPITKVTRLSRAGTFEPEGATYDLLAVDPATLSSAAYWNETFANLPFEAIAARLAGTRGDRVPAVVVAEDPVAQRLEVSVAGEIIPIEVVARADAFPGMTSTRPLVVMREKVFESRFGFSNPLRTANATTELWVRGEAGKALDALAALEPAPYILLTVNDVKDAPSIEAVLNTFGVLNVLAIAAAVLVLVVLLMYVQARQRGQIVAYGLSRHMGLRHEEYRRSLGVEIAIVLVVACALGAILAMVSARLVSPQLDPLASIPPDPLFTAPWILIPAILITALVVAWLGAMITSRRIRRAELGQAVRVEE